MPAAHDSFLARRWHAEVPWPVLFWRDMLVVGTVVNLFATFAALMVAAAGAPVAWAAVLHFAPLPYNLFLFATLWRQPSRPWPVAWVGAVWLALMTVV